MKIWECFKCGHEWASRQAVRPRSCAGCKVLKWWEPRKVPRKPRRTVMGRPPIYPLGTMQVGDTVLIPWYRYGDGKIDARRNDNIHRAIAKYEQYNGVTFNTHPITTGLKIERAS